MELDYCSLHRDCSHHRLVLLKPVEKKAAPVNIGTVVSVSYLLMVGPSSKLNDLSCLVGKVAGKQEHIPWIHLDGKPHEQQGVDAQCCGPGGEECRQSCSCIPGGCMEYIPNVILGLMMSGDFFMSAMAAKGMPQFATIIAGGMMTLITDD